MVTQKQSDLGKLGSRQKGGLDSEISGPGLRPARPDTGRAQPNTGRAQLDTGRALPPNSPSRPELLDQLRNQIRGVETAGRMDDGVRVSSGCAAIDRLLPASGYQRGTLVQWLTSGGQGADYLSLLVARQACQDGGALVVLDPLNQFYPPAAAAIGINLDNLIVLRTENLAGTERELQSDLLWSIDQALRCPAVAAVWGALDQIDERWFRRFQLSAETSGCLGLFVQPIQVARQPSWAEVQWIVSHLHEPSQNRTSQAHSEQKVRLQLTRCRGTQTGKTVNLSINTITGNVQPARRDHEQHQRSRKTAAPSQPEIWPTAG